MNLNRILIGGLLAGLVANVGHGILWIITGSSWMEFVRTRPLIAAYMEPGSNYPRIGFAIGYAALLFGLGLGMTWLYASIRPRYGAGPKTAVLAGSTVWAVAALADLFWVPMADFPTTLSIEAVIAYWFIMVAATLAGGWFYQEEGA